MISAINLWLTKTTMYRLMVYYLAAVLAVAVLLSGFGVLAYNPVEIILGTGYFLVVCWIANQFFARLFGVTPNVESQYITALILASIVGPGPLLGNLGFYALAAVVAMASKYLLVYRRRHIFNPAAFGVLVTALVLGEGASWWMGDARLFPFLLFGGLLILAKIRRTNLVVGFVLTYIVLFLLVHLASLASALPALSTILIKSPLPFFVFVMLVEPLTSPPDPTWRLGFGVATAVLVTIYQALLPVPYTLELALLSANLLTRIFKPDLRSIVRLLKRQEFSPGIVGLTFASELPLTFTAGQFLEWTLPHPHPDSRGIRRYFTISSSPSEKELLVTVKIPTEKPSSYKAALKTLKTGSELYVSHLEGEFVLPKDPAQKLLFIAGGIGVTPFRSMIKYLVDSKEKRDIVFFYAAKSAREFVFRALFDQAGSAFDLKTIYVVSEKEPGWTGRTGYIDAAMIQNEVPDWRERLFYCSGPEPMVQAFEKMLAQMGLPRSQLKRDYFPGYTDQLPLHPRGNTPGV